jgi:hypothetical protein
MFLELATQAAKLSIERLYSVGSVVLFDVLVRSAGNEDCVQHYLS